MCCLTQWNAHFSYYTLPLVLKNNNNRTKSKQWLVLDSLLGLRSIYARRRPKQYLPCTLISTFLMVMDISMVWLVWCCMDPVQNECLRKGKVAYTPWNPPRPVTEITNNNIHHCTSKFLLSSEIALYPGNNSP